MKLIVKTSKLKTNFEAIQLNWEWFILNRVIVKFENFFILIYEGVSEEKSSQVYDYIFSLHNCKGSELHENAVNSI